MMARMSQGWKDRAMDGADRRDGWDNVNSWRR
jgi:hypothetical protein